MSVHSDNPREIDTTAGSVTLSSTRTTAPDPHAAWLCDPAAQQLAFDEIRANSGIAADGTFAQLDLGAAGRRRREVALAERAAVRPEVGPQDPAQRPRERRVDGVDVGERGGEWSTGALKHSATLAELCAATAGEPRSSVADPQRQPSGASADAMREQRSHPDGVGGRDPVRHPLLELLGLHYQDRMTRHSDVFAPLRQVEQVASLRDLPALLSDISEALEDLEDHASGLLSAARVWRCAPENFHEHESRSFPKIQ